jgi:hypothetical protein
VAAAESARSANCSPFLLWVPSEIFRLSSPFGGDSSVGERDLDAGAAEVDHRDERVG